MNKRLLALIPVMLVVFLCSGIVYANDNANGYQIRNLTGHSADNNVTYQINVSSLHLDRDDSLYTNSGTYISYDNVVYINIVMQNETDQDVYCNNLYTYTLYLDSMLNLGTQDGDTYYSPYKITDVEPLREDNFLIINNVGTQNDNFSLNFSASPSYVYNYRLCIPARKFISAQFKVHISGFSATGVTVGNTSQYYVPTVNSTNMGVTTWTKGDFFIGAQWNAFTKIYNLLKEQFNAYNDNNVYSHSQSVDNNSDSLSSQSDTIHNQESGYYTQTNTALANTGLSNYQFSSDVVGGMGKVKDQFTYVWNKLGNYNVVYVFSLTLSIALMIIRHVRPIRRKQEE